MSHLPRRLYHEEVSLHTEIFNLAPLNQLIVDILHFNRECVECKHFKRGKLIEDKTCSRICKDEIVLVDELGEMICILALLVNVNNNSISAQGGTIH